MHRVRWPLRVPGGCYHTVVFEVGRGLDMRPRRAHTLSAVGCRFTINLSFVFWRISPVHGTQDAHMCVMAPPCEEDPACLHRYLCDVVNVYMSSCISGTTHTSAPHSSRLSSVAHEKIQQSVAYLPTPAFTLSSCLLHQPRAEVPRELFDVQCPMFDGGGEQSPSLHTALSGVLRGTPAPAPALGTNINEIICDLISCGRVSEA